MEKDAIITKLADSVDRLKDEVHILAMNTGNQTTAFKSFMDLYNLQITVLKAEISEIKKNGFDNESRLNAFDKQISKALGIWLAITTAITMFGSKLWDYLTNGH